MLSGDDMRGWQLWALPRPALAFVMAVELVATGLVTWGVATEQITRDDWLRFAVLAVAAFIHLQLSRAVERAGRGRPSTPYVDLFTVWLFAGAVLLPTLHVTLLAVGMYLHRWVPVHRFDPTRPPHRLVFNIAMMTAASIAALCVVRAGGLREPLLAGESLGWRDGLVLIAAMAALWTVNTVLVAVVIMLTASPARFWAAIGSGQDNLLEAGQLVLGAFVAIAVLTWPGFALLMIVPVVALHRTVLLNELQEAARTDDKTGLLNATHWHEQATAELERARQRDLPLGLLMIDLDLFSEVNNRHGHLAGDAVLRRFAQGLASSVRRGDAVGRFGGDEFAVLLAGVDRAEAMVVAERIREHMHDVRVPDGSGGTITGLSVSIGVALYPGTGETTVDELLAAADTALYAAKHSGRDRVHL